MSFFAGDPDRLARFRAGERECLSEVYRHYVGAVAGVLRTGFSVGSGAAAVRVPGLQSEFDVECACHEVFLRAFRPEARTAYDGLRPYVNYLFRIARNWRIDEFRRQRPGVSFDDLPEDVVVVSEPDADAVLQRHELQVRVAQYMETLPDHERRYFDARFREGLSQTDAAGRQGMTRIQGRRIETRVREGLLVFLRRHGLGDGA